MATTYPAMIDNGVYDRLADGWWDENGILHFLRTGMNPGRFGYFREVLVEHLGRDPHGLAALDIGCGGGLLAEEFAGLGCKVTGIDPSAASIAAARAHAAGAGLEIEYRVGAGEALPFEAAAFDIVYCCDTLEHVSNLGKVLAEAARVLKPGGLFFYDTINRTFMSNVVTIKVLQEWSLTAIMPPRLHDWRLFIKPGELVELMGQRGIVSREVVGLKSMLNPLAMIAMLRSCKRGEISYAEAGRRAQIRADKDVSVSYMGYGTKS